MYCISKNMPCARCAVEESEYQSWNISTHDARWSVWFIVILACASCIRGNIAIHISPWMLLVRLPSSWYFQRQLTTPSHLLINHLFTSHPDIIPSAFQLSLILCKEIHLENMTHWWELNHTLHCNFHRSHHHHSEFYFQHFFFQRLKMQAHSSLKVCDTSDNH